MSVSELAEYSFCPRAWHYRAHPPSAPPEEIHLQREEYGREYHRRALTRRESAESSGGGVAVAAAILLLLGILLLYVSGLL